MSETNVKSSRVNNTVNSAVLRSANTNDQTSNIDKMLNLIGIIIVGVSLFTVGFFSGKFWGGSSDPSSSQIFRITGDRDNAEVTELDFNLFWNVWGTLATKYVDKDLSEIDMYYGAIKGMVNGVEDPVTVFLTPEETIEYKKGNAGKFEGIGVELGYDKNDIVVVAPFDGSPATKAGLRAGDKIIAVDGVSIVGEGIYKAVSLIRGDKGTEVVLTVIRGDAGESLDIAITRDEIAVPSINFVGMEDKGIAVVKVGRFTEASLDAWKNLWDDTMEEVDRKNAKGLILDLRGNPGGYFNAAIWAAGDFLDNGTVVSKQRNRDGQEFMFTVQRDGRLKDIPIVVLIDGGSASASEILAGALQHYKRAYLIGEKTYGKGTAQEIVDFPDGSSLHITTLRWVLPSGIILGKDDVVVPDKEVELTEEDFKEGKDPQMDAAIEYLNSK